MEEEVLAELGLCGQCVTVKKKIVNCRGTSVIVDCQREWLQRLLSEGSIPSQCYTHIRGRERPDRWHFSTRESDSNKMPLLIRIFPKRTDKVIPLPKSKVATGNVEPDLSFSRLLAYVSQMNHRNLWKESYKKRTVPYAAGSERQQSTVNVIEHNTVMNEVIFRLYGFNIINFIKPDLENHGKSASEPLPHKSDTKLYEAPFNILPAVCAVEADKHIYTLHLFDYEYNLSDCIIFSPALLDRNYARCLFIIYQILQVMKSMYNRGLNFGEIHLKDIYLSDNLSIQILPDLMSNIHILNNDDIFEQPRVKTSPLFKNQSFNYLEHDSYKREKIVNLEKICHLWLKGSISNLDYLLHLNNLAGRKVGDPMAHPVVPWVTDFSSRCGKQWRDLTKSKYRLTKGDRQLDQTYEILGKELQANQSFPNQIPHHFSDVLSDITFYVYMARRTPKSVLCQYVRNNWVPAEYPSSIQRMQEWTPEECIPEFYTDPTVFRSAHEDLPDLEIPPWATCVEDFITKHREALESVQVSESLHHWIDLTFGYKLSGSAAIKAKNVCLSLVDGHSELTRSGPVQIFTNPHPARLSNTAQCWGEKLPPRIYWQKEKKKPPKVIESSDNSSDEEDVNIPQYYSTLTASTTHRHSISHSSRHKSHSRSRQHVKKEEDVKLNLSPGTSSNNTTEHRARSASATSSQFFKVQKSEWGKGPIYLPKEYNPTALLTAIENLHNFKLKTFYKSDTNIVQNIPIESKLMKCDFKSDTSFKNSDISNSFLSDVQSEENSFTNQMFVASYEQTIMKKQHKNDTKDSFVKDSKKDRSYNVRQVTDASLFKQTVLANRKKDMQVLGCLIVEIFLHQKIRPFHDQITQNFNERYKVCRLVLKNNIQQLPKCVRYVCCLLLQVGESNMNIDDLSLKDFEDKLIENMNYDYRDVNFPCISKKGLPPPTSIQLLQPLLTNQLLPFPNHFPSLYLMTAVLHEYSLSEKEMNILYSFNCDGLECSKYQSIDKARIYFMQKIAEAKVHTCSKHLEELLTLAPSFNQFDSIDIFLLHFIELLNSKDTSILAAWYLFDPVAKALGPAESSKKLLNLILNLYDDHEENNKRRKIDVKNLITTYNSRKSVKLYHNIFLLQLIVRFGLQCFLDNFIPHLVEAVGGYKDSNCNDVVLHSHSNTIQNKFSSSIKKLNYCEDNAKSSLHAPDMLSPDTSCGSENTLTPSHENNGITSTKLKKSPNDIVGENDVFHFENETGKELTPSIASDDTKSWDSNSLNKASIKYLINEIDLVSESPSFGAYLSQTQGIEATESICSADEDPTSKDPNDIVFDDNNYGNSDESPERNGTKSCTDTEKSVNLPTSPIIDIPNPHKTFTSYVQLTGGQLNFDTSNSELNSSDHQISSRSLEMNKENVNQKFTQSNEVKKCGRRSQQMYVECNNVKDYKISEMSYESLIWLAHRLGPVLTCKHITKNLLKMLTLCYIGTENLSFSNETKPMNGLDSLCIVNGRLSGDSNAFKVIECLTSIAALYGEQIILLQYFPHMGDLIASCRRRISPPLEGGLIACMQLLRFLIPYISDVKLMEQLQDIILKNILHPTVRLITSTRSTFPNGNIARTALAKKFLETLFIIATRIGVEMTRKHLCVPAMQRFFLAFDKVNENNECLKTNKSFHSNDQLVANLDGTNSSIDESGSYLEICRDGSTTEWRIKGGEICSTEADSTRDSSASPPDKTDTHTASALEELQAVFSPELAYESYLPFVKFVGEEIMQRSLKNFANLQKLCNEFKSTENDDVTDGVNKINIEKSESISLNNSQPNAIEQMYSNSFGSNIVKIGNRIDILSEAEPINVKIDGININDAFDIVSCKMESGTRSSRHLRGDWLMYWEHEIGRPEKDNRFNLKQIKLQTFNGHTHSIKNIVCLDNENSFMTASKDKTVKLWSLRNQGDGTAISSCQWTYAAHKKGVLSLTFLESLRLAVSTDANVHIWDPYVESVVAQLDNSKNAPISIVKAMPSPSSLVLAATTDTILKVIDTRTCSFIHDLKVSFNPNTFIRCICVSPSGRWIALGLATGHLSLIDPRTGVLLAHWKAHDGEILQLVTVNESSIVSSSLDQTMLVWSTLDGKLKFQLKGSTEPVHCLSTYYNELISGTTNNRIGVHTAVDQDASFSSTKLRSDTFKGVLTSMTVLPLNRLLLLGGESGNVILLC